MDAVIHLAWLIQPSRDRQATWSTNVGGSSRVFQAAASAGVSAVIHASSVGAYSAGPKDHPVAESWPTDGIPTCIYSREKVYVERLLDTFESRHPMIRVVRLRPDVSRAHTELGWRPQHSAADALLELLAGMRQNAGSDTPPLEPSRGLPGRLAELGTGVGATDK